MSEHPQLLGHFPPEPRERPQDIVAPEAIGPLRLLAAIGAHAIGIVLTWFDRYRQRRALDSLNDYMLKDIGVSRADVDRETSKQFWRE